jgi:hypothetical protein
MKGFPESTTSYIIGWVVVVTVIFSILLPSFFNIPVLPVIFFNALTADYQNQSLHQLSTNTGVVNPEGLLVHYDFDNYIGSSRQVVDISGGGYNAVMRGPFMKAVPGAGGGHAISFPGLGPVSGLYQIRSSGNPAAGIHNVSFMALFRTSQLSYNSEIASAVSTGIQKSGWSIGTLKDELWDDNGKSVFLNRKENYRDPVIPGTWTMKIITYNGSMVKEYINGVETGNWMASGEVLGSGGDLTIGSLQPFGFNFIGDIDDFRIYNYALKPEEVGILYQQEVSQG